MKEIEYPAIFRVDSEDPEFINVTFPDIFGGVTFGKGYVDATFMAKDLLKLMLESCPVQCEPPHSLEYTQKTFPNDKVMMIKVKYKENK